MSASSGGSHLASGPALGYAYQMEMALLAILPGALASSEATVQMEVLDDFSVASTADGLSIVQVQHSVDPEGVLHDADQKVWRSIGIWIELWLNSASTLDPVFTLLTTKEAAPGSAMERLTPRSRNVDVAAADLRKVATKSENISTESDRKAFLALSNALQVGLLERVTLADGSPAVDDLTSEMERVLAPTHERRFIPAMADLIRGWWYRRALVALRDGAPISADETRAAIDDARRSLSDRALPILWLEEFGTDELPVEPGEDADFLRALSEIDASEPRRRQALADFQRNFAHRSRWARRGLLGPRELERYDDELVTAWSIACEQMLRDLPDSSDEDALRRAGHRLWDRAELDIDVRIRPETNDGFIRRGSYHRLVDDQRVRWHPAGAAALLGVANVAHGPGAA